MARAGRRWAARPAKRRALDAATAAPAAAAREERVEQNFDSHVGSAKVVATAAASEAVVTGAEAKAAAMVVTMAAAMSVGLRAATVVAVQTVVEMVAVAARPVVEQCRAELRVAGGRADQAVTTD